ncbi:MAG TPA: aspartate aminotransferase family protein [Dehalococcoidia bacterium]|nr:aspartate aminotransferase family protein [Dehalococcoidia bacterium]
MVDAKAEPSAAAQDLATDYVRRGLDHLWVHNTNYLDLAKPGGMLVLSEGQGIRLKDVEGRTYIDAMSGLWVVNVGHGRKELAQVAAEQMSKLAYVNTFAYATPPAIDLATKLAEITPEGIERFFFVNSGSEAVETAIKMAQQWHYINGDKKRTKIISRRGSYHGATGMAMSVNGSNYANRSPFEPLSPNARFFPGINCYRCPYEKTYPECNVFCARTLDDLISFEQPETVAAVIAEPISVSNGNFVPWPAYWRTLRQVCDKHGVLLIADEVINGFGRSGKWFGVDHYGIQPDIMTTAKGLSSGYAPIACTMTTRKIADAFASDKKNTFSHGITFGTHPVSCAVALRNVEILEAEGLIDNSAKTGAYLLQQLSELQHRHPIIGDVRGIGLMIQVELVKDRETKEPFTREDDMQSKVGQRLLARGLLCRAGNSISIAPPLITNREDADEIVDIIDAVLGEVEQELSLW